ncbi:hypothetical protein SRHO_G00318850 [Serrasalmus rhombeus]
MPDGHVGVFCPGSGGGELPAAVRWRQEDRRCGASSHATARGRADCILSSSAHQTKGGPLCRRRWTGEGHTLFSSCRHGDDRPGLPQTLAKNKLSRATNQTSRFDAVGGACLLCVSMGFRRRSTFNTQGTGEMLSSH